MPTKLGTRSPGAVREAIKKVLSATGGISIDDLMARVEVSDSTVRRAIRELRASFVPVQERPEEKHLLYWIERIDAARRRDFGIGELLTLHQAMLTFANANVGTGIEDEVASIMAKIRLDLGDKNAAIFKDLDLKFFDVNELPHIYTNRADDVSDLRTAALYSHQLSVRHLKVKRGTRAFLLDCYAVGTYRKGIYAFGYSHFDNTVVVLSLDGFLAIDRRSEDIFERRPDADPKQYFATKYGVYGGRLIDVRVVFTAHVEHYATRRKWHDSQVITRLPDGRIQICFTVESTFELDNRLLAFGKEVEVCEPPALRERVREEIRGMTAIYAGDELAE